jgi:hypothetical protein
MASVPKLYAVKLDVFGLLLWPLAFMRLRAEW